MVHNPEIQRLHGEIDELKGWARIGWVLIHTQWTVSQASLYEEEGVEGWEWNDGESKWMTEIGDWDKPPPIPEELMKMLPEKLR